MNRRLLVPLLTAALFSLTFAQSAFAACANLPAMKLTVKEYHLDLNDHMPVCIKLGETFKITILDPKSMVGAGDVTVQHKPGTTGVTITGDNNSPSNKVTVTVNGTADPGDEFDFWIKVDGVGTLDPTVRVIEDEEFRNLKLNVVEETLDLFGTTLAEFIQDQNHQ